MWLKSNAKQMSEDRISYKKFILRFLFSSELIGFFITISLVFLLINYYAGIHLQQSKQILFGFLAIFALIIIYTVISLIFFLKPIKKLFLFLREEISNLEEKNKILSRFIQLPFLRSLDVLFRALLFGLFFLFFLNFYIKLNFYNILLLGSFFSIFASSCGIIYFLLLEYLVSRILINPNFRNKFSFKDFDDVKFLKFKYFWVYLLFLSFLLITSLSGAITSLSIEFWAKKTYRELMTQKLVRFKERLDLSIENIQESHITQIPKGSEALQKKILINKLSKIGGSDYGLFDKSRNEWIFTLKEDIQNLEQLKAGLNFYKGHFLFITESDKFLQFIEIPRLELNRFLTWDLKTSEDLLILDSNQKIIFSTNIDLEEKNLKDLINKKEEKSSSFSFYDSIYFKGKNYEFFTQRISENLSFGLFYPKSLYQEPIATTLLILASFFIFVTVVSSIATIFYLNSKIINLEKVSNSLQTLSNGTIKKEELSLTIDEFSIFNLSIIKLQDKLQEIIEHTFYLLEKVRHTTNQFTKHTVDLVEDSENEATSTEEISATTEEISSSMDRISDFTLEQINLISNLSHGITELTNVIKEAQSNLQVIREIINKSEKLKKTTENEIQKMMESIHLIQTTSDQITSIVGIVKEIADQINLLSLNASIEAARAGEYGKGFAVVAEEISKLSDKTKNSIKNIHNLIKNSNEQVKQGIKITNEVKSVFGDLIQEIQKVNQLSTKVAEVIIKQEFVNTGVLTQIKSVENKANEINSNINEQKLAIKEITNALSSINNNIMSSTDKTKIINSEAMNLFKEIETLKEHIQFFKIEQSHNSITPEARS